MSDSQTRIRPAQPADVPAIERVVAAAYQKYAARIGKKPAPMLDDYRARTAEGCVLVAEETGAVIGVLVLIAKPDHLLLDNIAVAPERQGRGVGRALLAAADGEALRCGYDELRLYTHVRMHENIAMYRALGWQEYRRGVEDGYRRVFFRRRMPADGQGAGGSRHSLIGGTKP